MTTTKTKTSRPKKPRAPREKAKFRTFFIGDTQDNKLHMRWTSKQKTMWLELAGEGGRRRKVGTVTISTRTMVIKRDRDKHFMVKMNGYGFNEWLLRETKTFDTIRLSDQIADWKVPVKFIIENGSYLHFKEQGFEKQLFVSLEQLEQFKVLRKESRRV